VTSAFENMHLTGAIEMYILIWLENFIFAPPERNFEITPVQAQAREEKEVTKLV